MSPKQIELARHALGLPNVHRRSYRNYFACGEGHPDHTTWIEMVAAGNAAERRVPFGNSTFQLTRKGADAALDDHEYLDPEDWP